MDALKTSIVLIWGCKFEHLITTTFVCFMWYFFCSWRWLFFRVFHTSRFSLLRFAIFCCHLAIKCLFYFDANGSHNLTFDFNWWVRICKQIRICAPYHIKEIAKFICFCLLYVLFVCERMNVIQRNWKFNFHSIYNFNTIYMCVTSITNFHLL